MARARRRRLLVVSLGVLVLSAAALTIARSTPHPSLPAPTAIRAALHDPATGQLLGRQHYTRIAVAPVDGETTRVSFLAGSRVVVEAAVGNRGQVEQVQGFQANHLPYGNWLAYRPALLVCVGALFVLMAAVAPLPRLRNLDAAAVLLLAAPVVLLAHQAVAMAVVLVALLYLIARLSWLAVGSPGAPAASQPLIDFITGRLTARERIRLLRLLLAAVVLVYLIISVTSPGPIDVIVGVMEGATKLIQGVLPYGHMPGDVMHGDTYPLFSYVLYTPLALVAPVHSSWDGVDVALAFAALVAVAVAAGLFRAAAGKALRGERRPDQCEEAGLRAALVWLTFPPLLVTVSTGTTDVVLAALVAFAILLWRRPGVSSALLAAAAWFKLAPLAILPLWLAPLRGRSLARAVIGFGSVTVLMCLLLIGLGGVRGPESMLHAVDFQFSRQSPQSVWAILDARWAQPIAQALVLSLIVTFGLCFHARPELGVSRQRIAAASAATLIAVQLVADYWAFLYLAWVIPLLALTVFAQPALERSRVTPQSTVQRALATVQWHLDALNPRA
jgi:Glycosyltransferase family 87